MNTKQNQAGLIVYSAMIVIGILITGQLILSRHPGDAPPGQDLVIAGRTIFQKDRSDDTAAILPTPFSGHVAHQLWLDPLENQSWYAATDAGLYASRDNGRSWVRLYLSAKGGERSGDENDATVFAVGGTGGTIFAGTREGLLVSSDDGSTWQKGAEGFAPGAIPLSMAVSTDDSETLYVGTARHGVFRSSNGGSQWRSVSRGLPPAVDGRAVTPIEQMVIDPTDHDTVYVSTDVSGIYLTRDGGHTWHPANEGLPGVSPHRTMAPRLAIHPGNSTLLYTLLAFPVHDHKIESRLYLTTDRAHRWEYVGTLPHHIRVHSLSFTREEPWQLLVGHDGGVIAVADDSPGPISPDPRVDDGRTFLTGTGIQRGRPHLSAQLPPDYDTGNISVLHDDGSLLRLFDLNGLSIEFERLESDNYGASLIPFNFDTTGGSPLRMGDNDFASVDLPFAFRFYNRTYTSVFVNANGNITFDQGSRDRTPSVGFPPARVSPFWTDLDPSQGGTITVRSSSDQVVITWDTVPEATGGARNTFQAVLFRDHRIVFNFQEVQTRSGLTGISRGLALLGTVVDFSEELPLPRVNFRTAIYEHFDGSFDIDAIARRFYQSHADEFDFLTAFGASDTPYDVVGGAFAFYAPIQNDVRGIGRSQGEFNGGPAVFGSAGRLQGFTNMNKLSEYPASPTESFLQTNSTLDIMAQEIGHRWLAFVSFDDAGTPSNALLGRDFAHWSFFMDTEASELEGNRWRDNGNGTFTSIEATSRYSALDRYLMGLAGAGEVAPFFYIKNPTETNGRTSSSPPAVGIRVTGTRQNVSLTQIINEEGLRSPLFPSAPDTFTQAFILVVPEGRQASTDDLIKVETIRQTWEAFFQSITAGRGRIKTGLGLTAGADFTPANVGVSPATVSPGGSVTVSFSVLNQGTVIAPAALHEVRFSNDAVIDPSDIVLASVVSGSLGPGNSAGFTTTGLIPAHVSPGQRFIAIVADSNQAVPEVNEANNTILVPITITGGFGADLAPLNFSVNPTVIPAGGSTILTLAIVNQGNAPASLAGHDIRLSSDSMIDGSDLLLVSLTTGELQSGESVTFSFPITIPSGIPPGGKFLGVLVDANNQVSESNESNNTALLFINVTNPAHEPR